MNEKKVGFDDGQGSTTKENEMNSKSLSDVALEEKSISHNGKMFDTIKEGLACVLTPRTAKNGKTGSGSGNQTVFYNPIQQFNRDLSVLAIRAYGEDLLAAKIAHGGKRKGRSQLKKQKAKLEAGSNEKFQTASDRTKRNENDCSEGSGPRGTKRKSDEADRFKEVGLMKKLREENLESQTTDFKSTEQGFKDQDKDQSHHNDEPSATAEQPNNSPGYQQEEADRHNQNPKHQNKVRILDALSATGLRALRYAKELPFTTSVMANDLSAEATEVINMNVQHNKLQDRIHVANDNAISHMYSVAFPTLQKDGPRPPKYDVVDLDPYGTAAPFFDAALQALNDNGGLLCVTCTDAAVWASNGYPEKTFALYGGTPTKGNHSHEVGLRLIIHSVATTAARYGLAIEPLLSLSVDFYARIFIRIRRSPAEVKFLASKTMLVYNCDHGCGAWQTQLLARHDTFEGKDGSMNHKFGMAQGPTCSPHCGHCGRKTHVSGPMWGGHLHNPAFVECMLDYLPELDKSIYKTIQRVEGVLSTVLEETAVESKEATTSKEAATGTAAVVHRPVPPMDHKTIDHSPFFFIPSALSRILHCQAPPEAPLRGALKHAGYWATRSHMKPGSIRTNAPWEFVWEMMREWLQQKAPSSKGAVKEGTPGWGIMHRKADAREILNGLTEGESQGSGGEAGQQKSQNSPTSKIVFNDRMGKERGKKRLLRYQMNPQPNWGPQARASGSR